MDFKALQLHFADKERNIYELAELFEQNRHDISQYYHEIESPYGDKGIEKKGNDYFCIASGKKINVRDNVVELKQDDKVNNQWHELNEQFLNYHKSLSVYTLINDMPVFNYFGEYSGLAEMKNVKVVDVGAGTGHVFCSLFRYPETIEYYLLDPNLRKLHDHFIRFYPKLSLLKLKHILSYAEFLPLKSNLADVVTSISAIDHYSDYHRFFNEAYRILKPGGLLIITSHLDRPVHKRSRYLTAEKKIFSTSIFERIARYLYFRKYAVGKDDHTIHLENTKELVEALKVRGFEILIDHEYLDYFIIKAQKKIV